MAGAVSPVLTLRVSSKAISLDADLLAARAADPAGFTLEFRPDLPLAMRGNATVEPSRITVSFPVGASYGSASFRLNTSVETPPGTFVVPLLEAHLGLRSSFAITVLAPAPKVTLRVEPGTVQLLAGSGKRLELRASNLGSRDWTLTFRASWPSALRNRASIRPSTLRINVPAGSTRGAEFQIIVDPSAPTGEFGIELLEDEYGFRADFRVHIQAPVSPPLPIVIRVSPSGVAAGTLARSLRLTGEHFMDGATILSASNALDLGPTRVLSSTLAETTVSVRGDASAGRYRLDMVNPGGGRSLAGAFLQVHAANSLAAPASVQTAAVVYPSPGTQVGRGESLRPRGLLATSGTGPIVGAWLLDGMVFDRFVARATGGLPVEVEARIPLPGSVLGTHRLQLAIESPQRLVSQAVTVVRVSRRASRLQLIAPRHEVVMARAPSRFRWTEVPGAAGYEIEIDREGAVQSRRFHSARPRWVPPAPTMVPPGRWSWRVCPIFPGGVRGEPTGEHRFIVLPPAVELDVQPPTEESGSHRLLVRWRGGVPGVLYRIEVLDPVTAIPFASAYTARPSYLLPAAPRHEGSQMQVRVTALGPEGVVLGRSAPRAIPDLGPRPSFALARSVARPEVTLVQPVTGSSIAGRRPRIEARWRPPVPAADVTSTV